MDAGKEGVGGGFFAFCGDVVGQGDFYALVYHGHDVGQVEAMDFTNAQPHVGHEGEDGAVAVGGEVAPYEFYLFVRGAFLDGFIGGEGADDAVYAFGEGAVVFEGCIEDAEVVFLGHIGVGGLVEVIHDFVFGACREYVQNAFVGGLTAGLADFFEKIMVDVHGVTSLFQHILFYFTILGAFRAVFRRSNTKNLLNVYFTGVDVLSKWDKMTLLNAAAVQDDSRKLSAANVIPNSNYTVGTTGQGTGTVSLDENWNVIYRVDTYEDGTPIVTAQEQTHNTLMGMEAGLAVINSGQEFIEKAVDGLGEASNTGTDGIAVFATMGGGKSSYETGSHINMNTWNGIIGVGKTNQLPAGKIQWGGFLEHGSGNFSIHSDTNSRGDGSSTYTGGGVVAKWTNKHDVYTEAGLRYGSSHDNASNVLQDALGKTYGYDVRANYYGGYLGLGKIYRLGKDRTLDVYGKFFSTRRDGVSFDAGGRYELDALQSNILRVGAKYGVKSGKVNWYGGLAYEHEFSGEATGKADGLPIRSASIKGGSLRMDLGATIKPSEKSQWTMRMGITGHTGKHRGIGGNFMLSYNF